MFKLSTLCIAALIALQAPYCAASATPVSAVAEKGMAERIDAAIASQFKADEPGATIIVTRNGKTILRKAYGMANLANKQALQPQMVMRLGSITKQFTAVAILMLAEQGKLALSDDITRFLPDFPTKGKKITIEHLLTHTSGIASYTDDPAFTDTMDKDLSVQQMVEKIKTFPPQFAPAERWSYSNSGYFLLGAIIEKVSGKSYADFMAENIFTPLGMKDSAYEGHERSSAHRVEGYAHGEQGFVPGIAISMSQPYAAGSLTSTVDDLARWDAAISAGKLLGSASWNKAFTAYQLGNGESTHYGYGWGVGALQGSPMLSHGGGINGFSTYAIRLPEQKVFVAVLTNAESGLASPEMVASKAAAIAIGKPFPDLVPVKLDAQALDAFVGVYKIDEQNERVIRHEKDKLTMERTGRPPIEIIPYASNSFYIDRTLTHLEFTRDAKGEVRDVTVFQQGGSQTAVRVARVASPPKAVAGAIKLDNTIFDRYVGKYALAPNVFVTVSRDGDKFVAQVTGQPTVEMVALAENRFRISVADAELRMEQGSDGKVSGLTILQNGREKLAKRL